MISQYSGVLNHGKILFIVRLIHLNTYIITIHSTLRNVTSARVSMPPKVKEVTDENGQKGYTWNVDLMKSEKHWVSWF